MKPSTVKPSTVKPSNVVKFPGKQKGANARNAVFTFAFTTLIGPAIAAAILGIIYLVSGLIHKGPPSLVDLKPGELLPYTAARVLAGYVWSALPAGITACVLAVFVFRTGTFHWLYGVMAAAVAATFWAAMSGGQASNHTTFIALIAAVAAVLGRMVLVAAKVVE